jgi:hypothetical protein
VKLHRLIEDVTQHGLGYIDQRFDRRVPIGPIDAARLEIPFLNNAKQAACFEVGDIDAIYDLSIIPELVRLPYAHCWFEAFTDIGQERLAKYGLLVDEIESSRWCLWIFVGDLQDQFWLLGLAEMWREPAEASGFAGRVLGKWHRDVQQILMHAFAVVAKFLSALHCKNVTRIEHKPDPVHQKRRAKQGRAPLFSYWTLHLDLSSSARERADQGGAHASPRLHLRRGHPRQFKPGEWTWVQPHVVGSKHGLVHKDYAVKVF